jgi:succinate dehydrogenase flavin-adding protein (antitoxin of CptAB toxin-antitoxin module)
MALFQSLNTMWRPVSRSILRGESLILQSRRRSAISITASTGSGSSSSGRIQAIRTYRGEAGEGVKTLSPREEELLRVAAPRSKEIFANHVKIPDLTNIPAGSFDPTDSTSTKDLPLEIRRKRLVYRSKQRGWLEVDLLLGTWASENVGSLKAKELDDYEDFVNLETIDIYNVITLRLDVPEDMKTPTGDGVVERIQTWARASPLGKADPEKYKSLKAAANLI